MAKMRVLGRSWIYAQIVKYFSHSFARPESFFRSELDLRSAFDLSPKGWEDLATSLNGLPWMRERGLTITRSQLREVKTLAKLTDLIYDSQVSREAEVPVPKPTTKTTRRKKAGKKKPARRKKKTTRKKAPSRKKKAGGKKRKAARRKKAPAAPAAPAALGMEALAKKPKSKRSGIERGRHEQAAPPAPPQPRPPRFANAAMFDRSSRRRLDPNTSLEPGAIVRLRLDIGILSPESHVTGGAPAFPDQLPPDVELDVMVSSTDFGVATTPAALTYRVPNVGHGCFFLPGSRRPAVAHDGGKYLNFYLKAPSKSNRRRPAHARIGYYYRNILVQSQQIMAHIGTPGGFSITTDFTLSIDLTHLEEIPERPRVSVLTNANAGRSHQLILRRPGTSLASDERGAAIEMKERNVGEIVRELRKALAARAPKVKKRTRMQLEADLRQFAPLGWRLYTQLPGQVPDWVFKDLQDNPSEIVLQVARPHTSSFVLPWGFIYNIPLLSQNNPTICPMVAQWDSDKSLFNGSPRECPYGPHSQDVLCPFGFWGFRYAIEQISSTDKPVLTVPAASNCDFVIAETQSGVVLEKLAAHVAELGKTLRRALPKAQLVEGKDRMTIQTLLGKDLPFVYFYCHGQKINSSDPNVWLAVGRRETITADDFIGWTGIWYRDLRRMIWNEVRPLIFINACHSLAIEPETLVSYVDAFVGRGRAAGVIGTEVKVSQTLAMDVAEQFFGAWLNGTETVESALRGIRIEFLRQGNLFGLVYTSYCWSELKVQQLGAEYDAASTS